ncbi:hypothetical protein BJY01DRAFT_252294 [Aspergillus pseudoustus]|uniref:BTB domain-containing protein n=1 Tax=Aspergillus pseudoustus TaxID=1810923 RepID=A0ABR4J747_9EURO
MVKKSKKSGRANVSAVDATGEDPDTYAKPAEPAEPPSEPLGEEVVDNEPVPAEPEDTPEPVKIEYNQPDTSPYEYPIAGVVIGTKRYGIPVYYLKSIPRVKRQLDWSPEVVLDDVEEDIGHTVIHFLYTGRYETLDSGHHLAAEYRRGAQAYKAARRYDLFGLEAAARQQIEYFGPHVQLQTILETAREVLPDLPADETWFKNYLKEYFASSFAESRDFFRQEEFVNAIGQSTAFDKTIRRFTVDILFARISELEATIAEQAPATEPEPAPEPEQDLDPALFSEPLSDSEALPEPAPEPEYPLYQPATEEQEEVLIPEPEISDGPEYTAETPLGGIPQSAPASPRPEHDVRTYNDWVSSPRAPSPVEISPAPEPATQPEEPEYHDTWGRLSSKKSRKKKKRGSFGLEEVAQPPSITLNWA